MEKQVKKIINGNDIIKALQCKVRNVTDPLFRPACNLCVYKYDFLGCNTLELYKDIIDFINCQNAEVDALKLINSTYVVTTNEIREIAIKEFADRLQTYVIPQLADGYTREIVLKSSIDHLVKEMTGEGE